ncbi:MAG: hypothetical protein GY711_08735 [bacterium]|nr:hypothetical protein [bacterium]
MEPRDRKTEDLLDALRTPAARPEFKARLRSEFVGAEADADASVQASVEGLATALDALEVPAARAEFKVQLRDRFVGGDAVRRPRPVSRARRAPRARSEDGRGVPRGARSQRRRLRFVVGGVLAAAAAILLVIRPIGSSARWATDSIPGEVWLDGVSFAANTDTDDFLRSLAEARQVRTGGEGMLLRYADQFAVALEPKSTLDISAIEATPTHWKLNGINGSFRVVTGPGYDADVRMLQFTSPHALVEARGTVFGIDIDTGGTCTCCLRERTYGGFPHASDLDEVPARCSLYLSATADPRMCVNAPHLGDLEELDKRVIHWRE